MDLIGSGRRRLLEALAASLVTLIPILAAGVQDGTRSVDAFWSAQTRPAFAAEGDPFVWAVGGTGPDEARHLAVDSAGNVYLAGMFSATIDADPGQGTVSLTSVGSTDVFLAKYGPGGEVVWAFGVGGPDLDGGMRVAADAAGYVYVAGWSSGDLPLQQAADGQVLMGRRQPGGTDALLARYSPDGQLAWTHSFGGAATGPGQSSLASTVIVDPWGDVLVAGRFFGSDVNFDPGGGAGTLRSAGQCDAFVARYGPDGALRVR